MTDEAEPQQPAAEPTAPVENEAPASIEDTIRSTYKSLSEPKDEPEPEPTGRQRDAQGRFTKAETPDEAPPVEEPPEEQPPVEEPEAPSPHAEPPSSWSKEAKEAYAALPENVKAEVHRREDDFHRGIGQYKEFAGIGQVLHKEIEPYADLIRSYNTSAPEVIRNLLSTQKTLTTGTPEQKAQVIAQVLRDYQIDTATVNAILEKPPAAKPDPQFLELSNELQQLRGQLSQAQLAPFIEQVNKFAADPQNEFFPQVEDDMNALLAQGRAKDLKDAYDKAIWANPEIRAKLISRQEADKQRKAAETAAAAKRAGSTNVQRRGTPPVAPANGTMEDTIRNTYREIVG